MIHRRGFLKAVAASAFLPWLKPELDERDWKPLGDLHLEGPYVCVHGVDLSEHCREVRVHCDQYLRDWWGRRPPVMQRMLEEVRVEAELLWEGDPYSFLWMLTDRAILQMRLRWKYARASKKNVEYRMPVIMTQYRPIAHKFEPSSIYLQFVSSGNITRRRR